MNACHRPTQAPCPPMRCATRITIRSHGLECPYLCERALLVLEDTKRRWMRDHKAGPWRFAIFSTQRRVSVHLGSGDASELDDERPSYPDAASLAESEERHTHSPLSPDSTHCVWSMATVDDGICISRRRMMRMTTEAEGKIDFAFTIVEILRVRE
uniref:Uncharacterized protein n=1 Tax=Compsopogon caeruleus TaxID=31354 RepID=A0A7S1TG98_9RHOD